MNKTMYISITMVSLVLGLMVAFQFRTAGQVDSGVPIAREQLLTTELQQLDKGIALLQSESKDLENKLNLAGEGKFQASQAVQDEIAKTRQQAGLLAMTGPGVVVTMVSTNRSSKPGAQPLFNIRDEDLLRAVNELRAAGAEALSVNGQRVVSTTEIRQAGSFIDVNLNRISSPYQINAIGDPNKLESALEIKGGLVDTLQEWGTKVSVQQSKQVQVPAYTGQVSFQYAKPVKEGENQ